ncbi:MAG: 3-isopropylmalate dehydratase small subunit [Candidatus Methylacidiphilales bacterium]
MPLEKILQITGRAVSVPGDDLDTDRIIPARYMKCVTFDGLGEFMFYDVRFDEQGNKKQHPLNDPRFTGASILVSGNNFGCGSSREHAPQAIYRHGFRAIIAEGFAEIFFGNSTTLGMPCVTVSHADRLELMAAVEADPSLEVTVDVVERVVKAGNCVFSCAIREAAREGLITGHWDPIADLLDGMEAVETTARRLAYMAA